MSPPILDTARAIRALRYSGAEAVFAAGSIVRGEGTAYSDLDLVVVFPRLEAAYRESFRFDGLPVEAFVHDPETLEYFFVAVDRQSGIPTLPQMVFEGVEIPEPTELSERLKRRAADLMAAGPPILDDEAEQRLRYLVSDLLDDLRAPRSRDELIATGARLYEQLADYHLRRRGLWSAKGKAIPRVLERVDGALAARYGDAFAALFSTSDSAAVIRLTEELLHAAGGTLFEGFRLEAPSNWRKTPQRS